MIKVITQDYVESNIAVRTTAITFFGLLIYKLKKTTTNNIIVEQLTPCKKLTKIKGFRKDENEN